MTLRTCVSPGGKFTVGIHDPGFEVENLREKTGISSLGRGPDGTAVENHINFPESTVKAPKTDRIYEIANPLPFRGATFINTAWADRHAGRPETISVPAKSPCSLSENLTAKLDPAVTSQVIDLLPRPLRLALAQASTDPAELSALAKKACTLLFEGPGNLPTGIAYKEIETGSLVPDIHDHEIFDILGNNPHLPDAYKEVMVLRPGVQGNSEIIGEFSASAPALLSEMEWCLIPSSSVISDSSSHMVESFSIGKCIL